MGKYGRTKIPKQKESQQSTRFSTTRPLREPARTGTVSQSDSTTACEGQTNILDLPIELHEMILKRLSFDEIAKMRMVNKYFDQCCQRMLNRGFLEVEKFHQLCYKEVKGKLPRRESERRTHPLARHCDVLSAIETRLSLLGMTYMKYVDVNLCCFIPGKVIDEIYRVLRFIQNNPNPPRVHELLQELRDISSMAMEYFEEKIAPSLKSKLSSSVNSINVSMTSGMTSCRAMTAPLPPAPIYFNQKQSASDQELQRVQVNLKQFQKNQNQFKKEINEKVMKRDKELASCQRKIKEMEKVNNDNQQTIAELKSQIEDLKRRITEDGIKVDPKEEPVNTKSLLKRGRSKIAEIQSRSSAKRQKSIEESEVENKDLSPNLSRKENKTVNLEVGLRRSTRTTSRGIRANDEFVFLNQTKRTRKKSVE